MITLVSPDEFIIEVKQWGVRKDSLHKVRMMQKGELVYFRFSIPGTSEIIETVIKEIDYNKFSFVELSPVSTPAVWKDDFQNVIDLIKQLKVQNANTQTEPTNRDNSPQS